MGLLRHIQIWSTQTDLFLINPCQKDYAFKWLARLRINLLQLHGVDDMATRAEALRGAIKARQQARTKRQQARQKARTERQAQRQETKRLKISAKERSGAYTPEARAQRGAAIRNVVGTVAGAASAIPGVPDQVGAALGALSGIGAGSPVGTMGESQLQSFGGSMPAQQFDVSETTQEEKKPIYTNPFVIGGAAILAFLLLRKK